MRRRKSWLGAALGLCMLVLGTAADAKILKIATVAPEDSPWFDALAEMANSWETASGSTVKTRLFCCGIAGDEFDLVRKMRVGQLDAAMLSIGSLPDIAWQLRAMHMPLLIESYDELDYVMEDISPVFDQLLQDQGFRVLAWGDAGWVHFFSTKPILTPDDLRPMPFAIWTPNSAYLDAWKDWGFKPVPVPAPEILPALSTGLIEAIVVPPIVALSNQWFGVADNMTAMAWAPMVGAIVISERSWRKVPKGQRAKFLALAAEASEKSRAATRAIGPQAIAAMQARGLRVHKISPQNLQAWRDGVQKGFSPLIGAEVPADLMARVQKRVAQYRAGSGN